MAVERLLREGYHVARPVIDDGFDLLAFWGRRYWRIQVKATSCSGRNRSRIRVIRPSRKERHYHPDHVDAFVLVHTGTGTVLCVPVAEARGSWVTFRSSEYHDFSVLRSIEQRDNTTSCAGRATSGAQTHDPLPEGIVTTVGKASRKRQG